MGKPHAVTFSHFQPLCPCSSNENQRRPDMPRFRKPRIALFSLACLLALAFTTNAQTPTPTPTLVMPATVQSLRVAGKTSLYCAGYIRYQRLPHMPQIVGAEEEQEQHNFAEGEIVYLNAGSKQGIKEGQT